MNRLSIFAFIRTFTWMEWLALVAITAFHVWPGVRYGTAGIAFQLVLGVCVSLALIAGFRALSKADKRRKD